MHFLEKKQQLVDTLSKIITLSNWIITIALSVHGKDAFKKHFVTL